VPAPFRCRGTRRGKVFHPLPFSLSENREAHHHRERDEGDEQRVHQHERGGSTVKGVLHDLYGMGMHKRRAVYLGF